MGALPDRLKSALERTWAGRGCRKALILTDDNVVSLPTPTASARRLEALGIETTTRSSPTARQQGAVDGRDALRKLVAMAADRHTLVVAVGGRVIGDLGGFVAATFARGLPLLMAPTTLLAQVDSSVGGKVGVNLPKVKNIVGAFHQPIAVWIDVETLNHLPDRELRCGLAEVVKYGVILDAPFFAELEADVAGILARRPASLRRIVARSCEIKADVVSRDGRARRPRRPAGRAQLRPHDRPRRRGDGRIRGRLPARRGRGRGHGGGISPGRTPGIGRRGIHRPPDAAAGAFRPADVHRRP